MHEKDADNESDQYCPFTDDVEGTVPTRRDGSNTAGTVLAVDGIGADLSNWTTQKNRPPVLSPCVKGIFGDSTQPRFSPYSP